MRPELCESCRAHVCCACCSIADRAYTAGGAAHIEELRILVAATMGVTIESALDEMDKAEWPQRTSTESRLRAILRLLVKPV